MFQGILDFIESIFKNIFQLFPYEVDFFETKMFLLNCYLKGFIIAFYRSYVFYSYLSRFNLLKGKDRKDFNFVWRKKWIFVNFGIYPIIFCFNYYVAFIYFLMKIYEHFTFNKNLLALEKNKQ